MIKTDNMSTDIYLGDENTHSPPSSDLSPSSNQSIRTKLKHEKALAFTQELSHEKFSPDHMLDSSSVDRDRNSSIHARVKDAYGGTKEIPQKKLKAVKSKRIRDAFSDSKGAAKSLGRASASLGDPPSIDLIAKFAVEKERQQQQQEFRQQQHQKPKVNRRREKIKEDEEDAYPYFNPNQIELGQGESISATTPRKEQRVQRCRESSLVLLDKQMAENKFERLASISMSQQNFLQSPDEYALSTLSGPEADFMRRQSLDRVSTAVSPLNQQPSSAFSRSVPNVLRHNELLDSIKFENARDPLKEQIIALEKQLSTITIVLERKEGEQERTENKLRRVVTELEALKRVTTKNTASLENDHEKVLVLLKNQHLKDMAAMASTLSLPLTSQTSLVDTLGSGSVNTVSEAHKQLLTQLEYMRVEQRRVQEQFVEERRLFQSEGSTKLLAQERTLKVEITDLKRQKTTVEDQLSVLADDFMVANSKVDTLNQLCRQLEQSRDEALEGQQKLRVDLKGLQQNLSGAFSMDGGTSQQKKSATGGVGGVDIETAMRLSEAKSDAKVRQLTNKLDFMKAQLASEQASSEDLKVAAARDRSKVDDLRSEFRLKMQEADRLKDEAVDLAEKQQDSIYSDRMHEFTALQAKVMTIQGQLQEAYTETATAQQREDSSRAEKARMTAHQITLRTEIDGLKGQLQSVRDEREQEVQQTGTKHSQEATVRRLDNERQYLKSQLASEITLKNELHEALFQCQQQLGETQTQWKSDVETLKESTSKVVQDASFAQQRSYQTAISLEAEVGRLGVQNRDLKEGFTQMRDQVRMEQLTIENSSTVNRRLQEQLEALKAEGVRALQAGNVEATFNEQQAATLNTLLAEQEEKQALEKTKLRDELSKQINANSIAQRDTLGLLQSFEKERQSSILQVAAARIFERIRKLRLARMSGMFRVWNTNTTLIHAATQFHSQVTELIRTTLGEAKREKEIALGNLKKECDIICEERELHLKGDFNDEMKRQKESDLNERREFERQMEETFQHDLKLESVKRDEQLILVQEAGEEALVDAAEERRLEIQSLSLMHLGEIDLRVQDAIERDVILLESRERALNVEWAGRLENLEIELKDINRKALIAVNNERNTDSKADQDRLTETLDALRDEMLNDKSMALIVVNANHELHLEGVKAQYEEQSLARLDQLRSEIETEEVLKRQQQENLTEKHIAVLQGDMLEALEKELQLKDIQLEEALTAKLQEQAVSMETDRGRGLKLEASKWKQALKEAEKRLALEVNQVKVDAREEKEREIQVEIAKWEEKMRSAAQTAEDRHRLVVVEIEQERAVKVAELEKLIFKEGAAMVQKMANLQIRDKAEKIEAVMHAENVLKEQLSEEWTLRIKNEVVTALELASAANIIELTRYDEIGAAKEKALIKNFEEQVAVMEADRVKRINSEASRWKKEAKKTEEMIAIKVEKARAEGRDEMEVELRAGMEEAEHRQREAVQVFNGELDQCHQRSVSWQSEVEKRVAETADLMKRFDHAKKKEIKLTMKNFLTKQEKMKAAASELHQAEIETLLLKARDDTEKAEEKNKETFDIWQGKSREDFELKAKDLREEFAKQSQEQVAAMEADRVRGLKLEASKWKQALKEAEKRLALEVNQAKADARDERERELQVETAESEARQCLVLLSSGKDETRLALEAVERDFAGRMTQLKAKVEIEREEAVLHAESTLKQQLSEEWMVRLRQEVDAAWEQATAVSTLKLAKIEEISQVKQKLLLQKVHEGASRDLKAETAKWQKILEEADNKLAKNVDQARKDSNEAKDQEMHLMMTEEKDKHLTALGSIQEELSLVQEQLKSALDNSKAAMGECREWQKKAVQAEELLDLEVVKGGELKQERDIVAGELEQLQIDRRAYGTKKEDEQERSERRLRKLRETWQQELTERLMLKDQESERLMILKVNEQAVALEADRVRGLKLEASKWKQALKEAEKRLALEVNQAKADARDERELELQVEIAGLEERTRSVVQAAEERHRSTVEEIEQGHAKKAILDEMQFKAKRIEAVQSAECVIKEQVSEEWMVRLNEEVNAAWKESAATSKSKLAKKQEALDNFKKDITVQSQRLASERNELQEHLKRSEERLDQLQSATNEQIEQIVLELKAKHVQITANADEKHKTEMDALTILSKNSAKETLEEIKEEHKRNLRVECKRISKPLEEELQRVHANSIEQIRHIEDSIAELKRDKATLAANLTATARKLEDETVSKSDLQQEAKKRTREFSFSAWQMAVGARKMRAQHEAKVEDISKQHSAEEAKSNKVQKELNAMVQAVLCLSNVFITVEDSRKKMLETLSSYRVDDMDDKRVHIKDLEKKLQQLGGDKDSLEEQRDDVEEEVERLDEQVREVEEQIREHSVSSSTVKGRINVAHARKKKRLDEEFERLLGSIEQKRGAVSELDDQIAEISSSRDMKEAEMVDVERQLVQILVEQLKAVLYLVEQGRGANEQCKDLIQGVGLPWPPTTV